MKVWAAVVAGGSGRRFGGALPKQFVPLAGRPVLAWTLTALDRWGRFAGMAVAVPKEHLDRARALIGGAGAGTAVRVVPGGAERAHSVLAALNGVSALGAAAEDVVFVHDGARPFPPVERFDALLEAAVPDGALLAVPAGDTLKRVAEGRVVATVDRSVVWQAQTPQAFPLGRLREAVRRSLERGEAVTDEAQAVERAGGAPRIVEGHPLNLKITFPQDLALAERLVVTWAGVSVGHGYDVHRLVHGRRLVLGGVEIPFERGLLGHSDADVLAHAVADAVLGAAGLGDLGRHFPDSDRRWKDVSSLVLLEAVARMLRERGKRVVRVDATVVAQRPRLVPFVARMEHNLCAALGTGPGAVTVKATTTEGLGFEGRGEGISAHAVALVGEGIRAGFPCGSAPSGPAR